MTSQQPYTYGGSGKKAAKHQAVRPVYARNPVGCVITLFAILIVAALLMGVDNGCSGCIGGDACSDYWKPGATASAYEKTAVFGGEALHAQLTAIASEAAHSQP